MTNHAVQSGAHSLADRQFDTYETPISATQALLRESVQPPHTSVWEPCAGNGAIVQFLRDADHPVSASDTVQRDFELHYTANFFEQTIAPAETQVILTNPPFAKHIGRFVAYALELVPHVIVLGRTLVLESSCGTRIQEHSGFCKIHQFRDRVPMMHRDTWAGPRNKKSLMAFAWFEWHRDHVGSATFHRITCDLKKEK